MRFRLVPTLAALTLASVGAAAEFAPALTIPIDDPALLEANNIATEDTPYSADADLLIDGQLWDYDGSAWSPITGIAITAVSGGTWAYDDDTSDATAAVAIASPVGGEAVLLDLVFSANSALIFTPDPDATAPGSLSFRAWDGRGGASGDTIAFDAATQSGGDQPFSSEERTLAVAVTPVNDAPPVSSPNDASFTGRPGTAATISVDDILDGVADVDGDEIAIVVTAVDGGATWLYNGTPLLPTAGYEVVLRAGDTITCDIPAGADPLVPDTFALTFRTYDGGAASGTTVDAAALVASGNASASTATATATTIANVAPVLGALPNINGIINSTIPITLGASDAEGDTLTWSVESATDGNWSWQGAIDTGTEVVLLFDATLSGEGGGFPADVTVRATDTFGDFAEGTFTVTALANMPPQFTVKPSNLAIAGQPYQGLILATDADGDVIDLELSVSWDDGSGSHTGTPAWGSFASTRGKAKFNATPPSDVSGFTINLIARDGWYEVTDSASVSVQIRNAVVINPPVIPLSSPGNPVYGAIAPGSAGGFTTLLTALAPLSSEAARGWWWSSGFHDVESALPAAAVRPSAGVFLASETELGLSFSSVPFPAPFAIDLKPGWTFFGVPPIYDGESTYLSHDWTDFCLQRADGTVVDDSVEILDVLAPAGDSYAQEPWGYDPGSGYAAVATLNTGSAYWVKNRTALTYRLVRVSSMDGSFRVTDAYGGMPFAPPRPGDRSVEQPPAPPAGSGQATAQAASTNSCGTGGLAGLLIATLGLLGLRRGRRS